MSAEYSVGQILAAAEAAENGDVRHPGMIADMLRELARIKADDAVDGRIDFKGMWNDMSDRTTTRPPARAAQSVDVADVRLLLECLADDHGGDHFEADCQTCAAFDRLAALTEKGNG